MTYCLGILLSDGLILASDSRTNAGLDLIWKARKLAVFDEPGDRVIALLSSGDLATTQGVVTTLSQSFRSGDTDRDLMSAKTLYDATAIVGETLRQSLGIEANQAQTNGGPTAGFLLGGQIKGERPRLFEIYTNGRFIEASPRTQFLQTGETKYGKPILDRALDFDMDLIRASKFAMLSFDATMRSNLSVAPPIDLLVYRRDSLVAEKRVKLNEDDPYLSEIRERYGRGLIGLVDDLPPPPGI